MLGGFELGGPGRKREIPVELVGECQAVETEIREAFRGVTREGGISWNETYVIDNHGSDEDRAAARKSDPDQSWAEVVDDPHFTVQACQGGFAFLNAIGTRYYLPAAMVWVIRTGDCESLGFHLTLDPRFREHQLRQWSLLDNPQSRCIARFIRFMMEVDRRQGHSDQMWALAMESHWSTFG